MKRFFIPPIFVFLIFFSLLFYSVKFSYQSSENTSVPTVSESVAIPENKTGAYILITSMTKEELLDFDFNYGHYSIMTTGEILEKDDDSFIKNPKNIAKNKERFYREEKSFSYILTLNEEQINFFKENTKVFAIVPAKIQDQQAL